MKYIVYYLDEMDLSKSDRYAERRYLLMEVQGESRFDTKEKAIERAESLASKYYGITVLEVYTL